MPNPSPLQEIAKLQEQIEQLKGDALTELFVRRSEIRSELKAIDAQLESLTGRSSREATPAIRMVTCQELKDLLRASPNQTVNIRRAGLDTTNIRTLANLHPKEIQLGGKGAWPTVALVK